MRGCLPRMGVEREFAARVGRGGEVGSVLLTELMEWCEALAKLENRFERIKNGGLGLEEMLSEWKGRRMCFVQGQC